jgi:hypothetical protein
MTFQEFYDELRKTHSTIEWRKENSWGRLFIKGYRKGSITDMCPITAVAFKSHGLMASTSFRDAADLLSLDYELTSAIVDAADQRGDYDKEIRTQLLMATGLSVDT